MSDLATREDVTLRLFEGGPAQILAAATDLANGLSEVVRERKLYTAIQGKSYVHAEGWTLLGTMLGLVPICVACDLVQDSYGQAAYKAHVEVRTMDGRVVGGAFGFCSRSERTWSNRDDYALAGMAETRATSRALRKPLGFVMKLAGYEGTAFEEMPSDEPVVLKAGPPSRTVAEREPASPDSAPAPHCVRCHRNKASVLLTDGAVCGTCARQETPPRQQDPDAALRRRMWAVAKKAGYDETSFKQLVHLRCGVESTKDLTADQVRSIVADLDSGLLRPEPSDTFQEAQ